MGVAVDNFAYVKRNRFTLSVRVGGYEDFIGFFCGCSQLFQHFALTADSNIFRFEVILYVNTQFFLGQVTNMTHSRLDGVLLPEIFP